MNAKGWRARGWLALLLLALLAGCGLPAVRTQPSAAAALQPAGAALPTDAPTRTPTRPVRTPPPTRPAAINRTPLPTARALGRTATPIPSPTPTEAALSSLPVRVESLLVASKFLGESRSAYVYLPPQYDLLPDQRFKVLYASDGQEFPLIVFDQMMANLIAARQMEPLIVVAVFAAEGDQREEEYGAGPNINMLGWGTRSEAYNHFLNEELRAAVDERFRTLPGAANTGIMGWSLGGLVAIYNAWDRPDLYGTAGLFSASLWWRLPGAAGQELQARVMQNRVRDDPHITRLRLWFEVGTREVPQDVDNNGVNDMLQDAQDLMTELAAQGYREGTDMTLVVVPDGKHELATWAAVLPDFLHWAYPAQ